MEGLLWACTCVTWRFHSAHCRSDRGVGSMFVQGERIITGDVSLMKRERSRTNDWQNLSCQIYFRVNGLNADWLEFPPLADRFDLSPWLCSRNCRHVVLKGSCMEWIDPLCGLLFVIAMYDPLTLCYLRLHDGSYRGLLSIDMCGWKTLLTVQSLTPSAVLLADSSSVLQSWRWR